MVVSKIVFAKIIGQHGGLKKLTADLRIRRINRIIVSPFVAAGFPTNWLNCNRESRTMLSLHGFKLLLGTVGRETNGNAIAQVIE
jgi:hypothetical protein